MSISQEVLINFLIVWPAKVLARFALKLIILYLFYGGAVMNKDCVNQLLALLIKAKHRRAINKAVNVLRANNLHEDYLVSQLGDDDLVYLNKKISERLPSQKTLNNA